MNVLITSVGIRGYLVKYFKDALRDKGKVFATDCSEYAPGLYDADNYFILPEVTANNYIKELVKICRENNINGVISLNDVELPVLAKNKKTFSNINVEIIISDPRVIDICYDKYKTFMFLSENGFSTPKTFIFIKKTLNEIKKGNLQFPLLIKPRNGSASKGIKKIYNIEQLQNEFETRKNLIIQEVIKGEEYGIDVFNNAERRPIAIFAKKKIKMRAGETDKAISIYDEKMIEVIKDMSNKFGFYGPVDIDLFKRSHDYIITEVNPRFGGGYPLSHALEANFPEKIISLINKEKLEPEYVRYPEDVVMMKQYEIVIKNSAKVKNSYGLENTFVQDMLG